MQGNDIASIGEVKDQFFNIYRADVFPKEQEII